MFVRTLGFVAATGLMTGLSNGANALPVTVPDLIAHRAVYDLELKDATDRSGIEGMTGRMVYEFTGSACQGYKTDFRFVTQINTGDAVRMTDQQTTTFEDGGGEVHLRDQVLHRRQAGQGSAGRCNRQQRGCEG